MPHVDFLGVGDFGVSTRADTVFSATCGVCVLETGARVPRVRPYFSSTSSCSRGHLLLLQHRDVQHARRLRRALSFTDTLEICRFVVGRWGGGELCTMVSACICVVGVLCMSSRLSCCRDNRPLTPPSACLLVNGTGTRYPHRHYLRRLRTYTRRARGRNTARPQLLR